MNAEINGITPIAAAHVLWCYGEQGGMEPGAFVRDLIALVRRADPANRYKLTLGFPEYVTACQEIETPGSGAEALRVISSGPGFVAHASDLPEGARLIVTARLELPSEQDGDSR